MRAAYVSLRHLKGTRKSRIDAQRTSGQSDTGLHEGWTVRELMVLTSISPRLRARAFFGATSPLRRERCGVWAALISIATNSRRVFHSFTILAVGLLMGPPYAKCCYGEIWMRPLGSFDGGVLREVVNSPDCCGVGSLNAISFYRESNLRW